MDKLKQWSLITGLVIVLILVGGFLALVQPKRGEASKIRGAVVTQEQANRTLEGQIKVLQEQATHLPTYQARLAAITAKVPESPALPGLIRQLSSAADSAGVSLNGLTPAQPALVQASASTPTSATAGTPASPTGSGTTAGTTRLARIPVSLDVSGGYFQVEQFLSDLESLPRSFLVTTFTASRPEQSTAPVAPPPGGGLVKPAGSLTVKIQGQVFMNAAALGGAAPTATRPTAATAPAAAH